ncbi:DUF5817 family protein [Halomarina ordinaria]|uniref:DUF5817 family protein n=1 Tax=Halomarina ordinaria TaxID=3033939 RepID=A0ABD5U872_9EURY|nr:DUF5817 domain-containing protein [Halomarina sp. PSRA2]
MYTVVGCSRCSALNIVEGRPETTRCPRCRRTTRFEKLRALYRSDDVDAAREVRARLLAERSGNEAAYANVGTFAATDADADEAVVTDEAYLQSGGVDTDAVREAGARAERGRGSSRSRKQVVLDALSDLDRPTEAEVVDYATDDGVPADYARTALEKLRRAGEVSESGGRYRRL